MKKENSTRRIQLKKNEKGKKAYILIHHESQSTEISNISY